MKFRIELGDDDYQIVGPNGEESGAISYGEPATLTIDGQVYMALIPEKDDEYEEIGCQVHLLTSQPTETEEVEFDLTEEDEEEPVPD